MFKALFKHLFHGISIPDDCEPNEIELFNLKLNCCINDAIDQVVEINYELEIC